MVMACFKVPVLSWNWHGRTEENHEMGLLSGAKPGAS
jgi:hypothetical protein